MNKLLGKELFVLNNKTKILSVLDHSDVIIIQKIKYVKIPVLAHNLCNKILYKNETALKHITN